MKTIEKTTKKQKLQILAGKIKWQFITLFLYFTDTLFLLTLNESPTKKNETRRRLVFIRTDGIGDFILWTASIEKLLTIYPKNIYYWTIIGNSLWTDLAKKLQVFDEVFSIECNLFNQINCLKYRFATLKNLNRLPADLIIHPTHSRDFSIGDSIARAIPASIKIASIGDGTNSSSWQRFICNRLYSQILPVENSLDNFPTMELIRSAEFLSLLSGKKVKPTIPDLRKITQNLNFDTPKEPYFVIFPGAGWQPREWGLNNFIEIAKDLRKSHNWLCVFCGSERERGIFSPVIERNNLKHLNLMGKTTLLDLVSVISKAKLIVSNETSAAHIGAACRIPTVCITGGGHFNRFVPWRIDQENPRIELSCVSETMPCFNCNWNCIYKPKKNNPAQSPLPCIAQIEPKRVLLHIQKALDESKKKDLI